MTSDDRGWADASAAQAPEAFADLYDRHVGSVYRYCLHVLGSTEDAEDVTQEVFVLAWTKRTGLRLVDRSVLPWLLVTSRNLSLNRVRQRRREARRAAPGSAREDGAASHPAADLDATARMLRAAIEEAVGGLSAADQTLYHLCITEGLSYEQAAATLGTTHGAVRNRLGRLRQRLRTTLTPQREGLS